MRAECYYVVIHNYSFHSEHSNGSGILKMEETFAHDLGASEDEQEGRAFLLEKMMPLVVPETPSPQLRRKTRRTRRAEETFSPVTALRSATPGRCSAASAGPSKRRKLERRRLAPTPAPFPVHSWSDVSSSSSSSSPPSSSTTSDSLSFLTAEEREWLSGERDAASLASAQEVVIGDGGSWLRAAQMAEDEAMARILQARFDQEEAESRRHWTLHRRRQLFGQADSPPGLGRRRRNDTPLTDDFSGDNYEALLEFEERQGAVAPKKLTHAHVLRFPVKRFQAGGGATACQICFCDYDDGESLRMLPCFHDYHVGCIDRWLREKTTCPICRVNLADL
ncbi:E3 ubiquitin-protein ligase RLIM [Syngnathoides biaculeatus]|uniref:E3 ubiquitin-protein ligase RLIM n=1 Tax=Syngnathoides biaculeatus TaxID=300417 RepID=UPI002ADD3CC4|nr:E3 ubiquitin-protein ligase RLIM [Syngnathoides biaculeatus]